MKVLEIFDNINGIYFVLLNIVTPVFILVLISYFIGLRLQVEALSLSRPAYFVFVPAFAFNTISKTQIEAELAFQMVVYIFTVQLIPFFGLEGI